MSTTKQQSIELISPIDQSVYFQATYASDDNINYALRSAQQARTVWQEQTLNQRVDYICRFLNAFTQKTDEIAEAICWQMGRPMSQAKGEVAGVVERSEYMMACAESALVDTVLPEKKGFKRYIRREALGTVFVIAPWNYPFLTAINTIVPALLAGNTVILKHAAQTAQCAEILFSCFQEAGLPEGVFQYLHLTHTDAERVMNNKAIDFVAFTGSVEAGRKIQAQLKQRFIGIGLELGGKDAAYVRHDANLENAVAGLVDGAMFNSGQSCCGIERIYVHEKRYIDFVDAYAELTKQYVLADPREQTTTLGPVVSIAAANTIREQLKAAIASGAKSLIDPKLFAMDDGQSTYLAPQVLIDCPQASHFMQQETFGPCVGILPVKSDDEAIRCINDSAYGLTASVWTQDLEIAESLGKQVQVGTWFMNRCDYLDPGLAWTGVKDTGRGVTLSEFGYQQLTRLKSFHLKL